MDVKNDDSCCSQQPSSVKFQRDLKDNGLNSMAKDGNGKFNFVLDDQQSCDGSMAVNFKNLDEIFDADFDIAILQKYEREKEIFNNHNDAGKFMLIRKCLVPYMFSFFDKLTTGTHKITDVTEQPLSSSLLRMNFEIMENNIKSSLANFMKKIQSSDSIQFGTMEAQTSEFTYQLGNISGESLFSDKSWATKTVRLTEMTDLENKIYCPKKDCSHGKKDNCGQLESSSKESSQIFVKQCDCKMDNYKQSKNTYVRDSDSEDIKRLNKELLFDQKVNREWNLEKKETLSSKSLNPSDSGVKLIRICRTEPGCSYVETGGHNMPRHVRNNHNNLRPEYDSRYVDSLVFEQMQRIWLEQQQKIQKKRFGKRNSKNQEYQRKKVKVEESNGFEIIQSVNLGKKSDCDESS